MKISLTKSEIKVVLDEMKYVLKYQQDSFSQVFHTCRISLIILKMPRYFVHLKKLLWWDIEIKIHVYLFQFIFYLYTSNYINIDFYIPHFWSKKKMLIERCLMIRSISSNAYLLIFQYREERFRQTSESTNQRVLWWSIAQTVILLITGFWQMRHLKSFFEAKKLV